jgi:hypothetical protein
MNGTLEVYRQGWTAQNSKGRWVAQRPANQAELRASAEAVANHGMFWLDDNGQPYHAYMARKTYHRAARVVPVVRGRDQS